eukprot:68071_1
MTLSQQEAIILGCIIGSFIVIVFGLLLWHFCGDTCTPHQIKPDYSKLHIPTNPVVPHPNSKTHEKESQSIEMNELSQDDIEVTESRRNPQCEITESVTDYQPVHVRTSGSLPPNPMDWKKNDIHNWLQQKGLESLHSTLIHEFQIHNGKTLLNLQ